MTPPLGQAPTWSQIQTPQKLKETTNERLSQLSKQVFWGDLYRLQRLSWLVERTKERTTEQCSQILKKQNNAAAGYPGPEKIELLKSTGRLSSAVQIYGFHIFNSTISLPLRVSRLRIHNMTSSQLA